MAHATPAIASVALALLITPALATDATFVLRSGYFEVKGDGARVESLRVDPSGWGRYGANLTTGFGPDEMAATPRTHAITDRSRVTITGLERRLTREIAVPQGHQPDAVPPGGSLGQSFTVAHGTFHRVAVHTPTWHTTDSGALLRLRRDGPAGAVVAERRLENVADNSRPALDVAPQPAGRYYVELCEPKGQIGWWTNTSDVTTGGEAFAGGKPAAGRDRVIQVEGSEVAGPAVMRLSLEGPKLAMRVEWTPPEGRKLAPPPLQFRTTWTKGGYDVSARAGVRFKRYFTDDQRYWPAEQLKRRETAVPGIRLGPCAWIEADGTEGADLRFSGKGLVLSWQASEQELSHQLRLAGGDEPAAELDVEVLPRDDALPAGWPSFFSSNAALDRDLNRFLYERAFTYPAGSIAPWVEWSALIRAWFAGPLRDGERHSVETLTQREDGYVCTWGSAPGWPFPDNAKYDTRHFDTNARFILAAWRHYCWTRDTDWLRGQAGRLRKAMAYQLGPLQGEKGLIVTNSKDITGRHESIGSNYWDILPFGHLDAYCNALFHGSLLAMAEIERVLGGTPDVDYAALAERCRKAYDATFWDAGKGRYIGCVDVDGERHDYGFTFANLEALYYGLGDAEKAARIYQWMELQPTSSGEADTYSRWVFAPRATTVHNPRWGKDAPDATASARPWWFSGWHGTPWEEQCQDGGAILYTSFYDLMDRVRYRGADNAWQRFGEILKRYRDPDRLCGGPPLFRGETPQQENPGSVGVDMPFPESGLVPCYFLYGVLGISVDADGLHVAPRLPRGLSRAGVRNLSYCGRPLTITATPGRVRIECREPGRELVIDRRVAPGRGLTLGELAR